MMTDFETSPYASNYQQAPGDGEPIVRIVDMKEVASEESFMNDLEIRIHVIGASDSELWETANTQKAELEELITSLLTEKCGGLYLKEIRFEAGSLTIIAILAVVQSWLIAHSGILGAIGAIFGLYQPVKEIAKDLRGVIPKLIDGVKSFFSSPKKKKKLAWR
jgi:hypothetical protein